MSKKENTFDFEAELKALQYPDWLKNAFKDKIDTSKIKNKTDLEKEFKKYMELKE